MADPQWYGDRLPKVIGNMIPNIAVTTLNAPAGFTVNYGTQKQELEEAGVSSTRAAIFAAPIALLDTISGKTIGTPIRNFFMKNGTQIITDVVEK